MKGGEGCDNYSKFSKFQGTIQPRALLIKSIQDHVKLPTNFNASSNTQVYRIADLGCSIGTNSFACVETIVAAVKHKFKYLGLDSRIPEFQVLFNDNVTNDFNTLFKMLPSRTNYTPIGVPGSIHDRLFPEDSMDFVHSLYANHWLSEVPQQVTKEGSEAWNKGNISYVGSSNKVVEAYRAQFFNDMDAFFKVRSLELVKDGLLAIILQCRPDGTHPSESIDMICMNLLGHTLYDMEKEGLVTEALVDSFNLPNFVPCPSEVLETVSSNDYFSIEILEKMKFPLSYTSDLAKSCSLNLRAMSEGLLTKHFGSEIIGDLFARYKQKLDDFMKKPYFASVKDVQAVFLLVKRNGLLSQ